MSQQNLDDANVHALLEHVRGEAVTKRVRPEAIIEAALASRFGESGSCGGVGKRGDDSPTGATGRPLMLALQGLVSELEITKTDLPGQTECGFTASVLPKEVQDHDHSGTSC
jgi:hypothetical protein